MFTPRGNRNYDVTVPDVMMGHSWLKDASKLVVPPTCLCLVPKLPLIAAQTTICNNCHLFLNFDTTWSLNTALYIFPNKFSSVWKIICIINWMRTSSTQWAGIRQNNLITFNNNALKKSLYMGKIFISVDVPSLQKTCPLNL